MGEILAPVENGFQPGVTLMWENVVFSSNYDVLTFVPYTKSSGFEGKIIDLYPIEGSKFCPSASLRRLKKLAIAEGVWKSDNPVFTFKSGKFLTKQKVNLWLSKILNDFTDDNHIITGHSFRAAIPSILASHPNKSSVNSIKEWGGWASDSYKAYIKSEKEKRRILFEEIMKCVLSEYNY